MTTSSSIRLLPRIAPIASRISTHGCPHRKAELAILKGNLTCVRVVAQSTHYIDKNPSFATAWCADYELIRDVKTSTNIAKITKTAAHMAEAKRKGDDKVTRAKLDLKKSKKASAGARREFAEPGASQ